MLNNVLYLLKSVFIFFLINDFFNSFSLKCETKMFYTKTESNFLHVINLTFKKMGKIKDFFLILKNVITHIIDCINFFILIHFALK